MVVYLNATIYLSTRKGMNDDRMTPTQYGPRKDDLIHDRIPNTDSEELINIANPLTRMINALRFQYSVQGPIYIVKSFIL